MKTTRSLLWLSIFTLFLGGCEGVVVRKYSTHGPNSEVVPSAPDAPVVAQHQTVVADSRSFEFALCTTHGIMDVVEDTSQNWYQTLTLQYQLPATTPLLRMLIEQSGCFNHPDPDRSYKRSVYGAMQSESDRALYGDLGSDWDIDYTLTPSINFAAGTDGNGMRKLETAALTLTDARSGAQVAINLGVAAGNDFSFGALARERGIVDMDAWQSTPEGAAISGAFIDAFNQMLIVASKHDYERAQEMGRRTGFVRDDEVHAVLMPIRQAQMRLAELKFYAGAIDGVAGVGMAKALSAFQRAKGLRVTGQLDLASSAALAKGQ